MDKRNNLCLAIGALTFAVAQVTHASPAADYANAFFSATNSPAAQYATILEGRFLAGEAAASIRSSFETNKLFSLYEILPYCYEFTADTNNLISSVEAYERKLLFLKALWQPNQVYLSSNVIEKTIAKLLNERTKMYVAAKRIYNGGTGQTNQLEVAERIMQLTLGFQNPLLMMMPTQRFVQRPHDYVAKVMGRRIPFAFTEILNLGNYDIHRSDLYAELSTNASFNADAMFRYCLTDRADFPTNDIAIAEKEIWRNNFVLEIVTHSCNLHTNEANRAHDAAYTNLLATLLSHYESLSADATDIFGTNRVEWLQQLGATIDAYTQGISPFKGLR